MQLVPTTYVMKNGRTISCFSSHSLPLVKLDFVFESGPAYQDRFFAASMANTLLGSASLRRSSREVAEFFDYRGIVLDRDLDSFTSTLSVYTLKKYIPELLPMIKELIAEADFRQEDFDAEFQNKRCQFLTGQQQTSTIASRAYYESLYGKEHVMGRYADLEHLDALRLEDVERHFRSRYDIGQMDIIVSGDYDDSHLYMMDQIFGSEAPRLQPILVATGAARPQPRAEVRRTLHDLPGAQATLRIGRLLPFGWQSMDMARFQILNAVLGGYFGSRLMSNIREDKGYTYGISSRVRLVRGSLVFSILSDVGSQYAEQAVSEIRKELVRLCEDPIPEQELAVVRKVQEGSFIRSVDGIFECAERYRLMRACGVTEQVRDNEVEALRSATPGQLRDLAEQVLQPQLLTQVVVD